MSERAESRFTLAPQETLLGMLGEYLEPGGLIWAGGFVKIFEDLGFTDGSARIAMNRVVARGLLERTRRGRLIFYGATPRLVRLLDDGRRQTYFFQRERERSDVWTFVWYSIPHEFRAPRRRLARRLSFLGFGLADDGQWVLPRDSVDEVREAVAALDVSDYVDVYLLTPQFGPNARGPLMRAWDLDRIHALYEEFLERYAPFADEATVSGLDGTAAFVARTGLIESFRQLASLDPQLPEAVIDRPWLRDEAIALFARANGLLAEPAQRHFAFRTDPGSTA